MWAGPSAGQCEELWAGGLDEDGRRDGRWDKDHYELLTEEGNSEGLRVAGGKAPSSAAHSSGICLILHA